jgi:excisionase family DNA binding protein
MNNSMDKEKQLLHKLYDAIGRSHIDLSEIKINDQLMLAIYEHYYRPDELMLRLGFSGPTWKIDDFPQLYVDIYKEIKHRKKLEDQEVKHKTEIKDKKIDVLIKDVAEIKNQLGLKHKKIWAVKDVAVYCGRSAIWVYKLVKEQSIPFYRSRGRLYFKRDEIERWWSENRYRPYK